MASLFKKAKENSPAKTVDAKKAKPRVTITEPGFFEKLKRIAFLTREIKSYKAESDLLDDELKDVGKTEWAKLYEKSGVNPESIMIEAKEGNNTAQFMLLMSDKYINIDQERADVLKEQFGDEIVTETETYQFDKEMVEKYGEVISDLIMNCGDIEENDKEKIIKAVVANSVSKGTIDKLKIYADKDGCSVSDMISVVNPVTSSKNYEYIEASAING